MKHRPAQLLAEIKDKTLSHKRRLEIGAQLAEIGEPRPGVGVVSGLPDIVWLLVAPAGDVTIIRQWRPENPEEAAVFREVGRFPVAPFYIAKYLITNAQYQAFVEAEDGFENAAWWVGMPTAFQQQSLPEPRMSLPNQPRDTISWYQAVAFARWLNHRLAGFALPHPSGETMLKVGHNAEIRLPTEWEWQWAAQNGDEARKFPWGAQQAGFANTAESGLGQGTAVGMYPHGAAACGALDMAGNLMEWCGNDKQSLEVGGVSSTATKPLRGGDWGYGLENATCIYCDDEPPEVLDPLNGFRLVVSEK